MAPRMTFALLLSLVVTGLATPAAEPRIDRDIEYARPDGHPLALDYYRPAADRPPLVVWVHGGAWRAGSKADVPLKPLLGRGYAIASVDYRLSTVARFPAQVHDIKAAIRFLRANADRFGFDPNRVAIAGASAGGHLAALVGVTNGDADLEGRVGGHPDQSSSVSAIVSFYGASNLTTILDQSTPHGLSVRVPALQLLLGGPPDEMKDLARQASPVFHVDDRDPPLLLIHGDQDRQMPINQSHELEGAYRRHGRPVLFEVVHGAGHGGKEFYTPEKIALVARFLDEHLRAGASGREDGGSDAPQR